jgi:leucyl aminopeptidase
MNFELKTLDLTAASALKCDALVVLVMANFKPGKDALSLQVAQALKAEDLQSKPGKLLPLYRPVGAKCVRAVLAGAGEGAARQVRQAIMAALGALRSGSSGEKKLVLCFASDASAQAVQTAVLTLAEACYTYTTTKNKVVADALTFGRVTLGVPLATSVKSAFTQAVATVAGIEMAKEWANRPANHATPTLLAQAARSLSRLPKITCEVLGPKEVAQLGMGSFAAVAQGSEQPLRFIVLNYSGASKAQAPTVLIGKGITFDTGGISIKPAAEMDEMKYDMAGAASVLGVFRALADLKPAINVVGLIPTCENMPGGRALKPGDVVTSMSGQTIEVLNTDAEGRLILCDALTYAERFKPRVVVDVATLTGACVVALGHVRSGLFSSSDELAAQLLAAGESSMDLCWRMPLDDDYAEGLKSNFADVANIAGRMGGAITAAKFLQRFSEKFAWAHLDVAGTAWKSGAAKGATGRPVGLLIEFLLNSQTAPALKTTIKPGPRKSVRSKIVG